MKQQEDMKTRVEGVVYSGATVFLFIFSLIILAGVVLTVLGTTLQIIF